MPFRDPLLSLRDILDSIDMIVHFVRGMDFGAFREDPKTVAAVERKLLLISEAAMRLGEDADRMCPGLPWRNIRGIATGSGIAMTGWMLKWCGTQSSTTFHLSDLVSCAR